MRSDKITKVMVKKYNMSFILDLNNILFHVVWCHSNLEGSSFFHTANMENIIWKISKGSHVVIFISL